MIEGDETEDEDGGDVTPSAAGASSTSGAPPPPFPSYSRSSRIVSEALAGRKLEELSANELTQVVIKAFLDDQSTQMSEMLSFFHIR